MVLMLHAKDVILGGPGCELGAFRIHMSGPNTGMCERLMWQGVSPDGTGSSEHTSLSSVGFRLRQSTQPSAQTTAKGSRWSTLAGRRLVMYSSGTTRSVSARAEQFNATRMAMTDNVMHAIKTT